ncbi:MAG: hypothetical protein ACLFOC_03565 [Campylobacterales bacterium]
MTQKQMSEALEKLGVNKKEYEGRSFAEVESLYKKYEREFIESRKSLLDEFFRSDSKIQAVTNPDDEVTIDDSVIISEYLEEAKKIIKSKSSPYAFLERCIKELNQAELDILADAVDGLTGSDYFLFALRAKKHELIFSWTDDIKEALKDVDDAESFTILKDIKNKNGNINRLKELHKKLTDPKWKENFLNTANLRNLIIGGYMDEYRSEAYKEYYEETVYKQDVISKILKVTKNYSRDHLESKKLSDLKNIFEHYRKEYERIKKEKEAVRKYITLFREAIESKYDERELNKLMGNMFVELNENGVKKIIDALADASPNMSERIRISLLESHTKNY